jgi:hypothetical protein
LPTQRAKIFLEKSLIESTYWAIVAATVVVEEVDVMIA